MRRDLINCEFNRSNNVYHDDTDSNTFATILAINDNKYDAINVVFTNIGLLCLYFIIIDVLLLLVLQHDIISYIEFFLFSNFC